MSMTKLENTGTTAGRNEYTIPNMGEYVNQTDQTVMLYRDNATLPPLMWDDVEAAIFGIGVNSYNRLATTIEMLSRLPFDPQRELGLIKAAWTSSDDVGELAQTVAFKLGGLNEHLDFRVVLDEQEAEWFDRLPVSFTVHRGCCESNIAGISWTTDRNVAMGFAEGFRGYRHSKPVIVTATCAKEDVLLVCNEREEWEVIVDPEWLTEVKVTPVVVEVQT